MVHQMKNEQLYERDPVIHERPEKSLTTIHSEIQALYVHYFIMNTVLNSVLNRLDVI